MKKKHKITLLVIGILLALSLMLSSSYALWVFNVSQESTNVIQSDCFEITLQDNNPIGLSASFPMRDSDGVQTTPYTFTIRNICNHPADFQINLETLNTSTIDESFIKADLNGHITEYNAAESVEPTIDNAKSAAMLFEDTLSVNGEKTYNLRIWVNESATKEDVENKSYASKISVKAVVRKQYAEGTLINGNNFNIALKQLVDGGTSVNVHNTSIMSIKWSNLSPQEGDNAINIAENGTNSPIYAWFKDGTVYINSELDKIYMNSDSSYMFYEMNGVTSLDVSHFDTSNVNNMSYMFYGLSSITSMDVSNFDTSNVTDMSSMFEGMSALTSLDISNFDTSNVTTMSYMFSGMSSLTSLDISGFDTSKVTNMNRMFYKLSGLTSLDISRFDTSEVTDMSSMFEGMSALTSLDISCFNTSKVINMKSMFDGMKALTSLDISSFDTSKVTNMSSMFARMNNLTSIDLSNFDTSNVTDMSWMFCSLGVVNIDLSNFNTSKVEFMNSMFQSVRNLISLDLSNFDTSNLKDASQMFYQADSITSLNLSNFDTSKVTNMAVMFSGMSNLTSLNLSNFDTSNVTNMSYMFRDMYSLTSLDISNFDTSKVSNISGMFYNMPNLLSIYVSNSWNTSSVISSSSVFNYDFKLVGGAGTTYDENHTDIEYARVDDSQNGKPGYFTLKTS